MTPRAQALAAREAARDLVRADRAALLREVAAALLARQGEILAENAADVAAAQQAVDRGEMTAALAERLVLDPRKLATLAEGLRALAGRADPVGRELRRTELAEGLVLEQVTSPLGVLLVIFESRPDALVQIAGLALASGNGLLLKGGREARRSNRILHEVIVGALPFPEAIGLVETREEVADLLALDDVIDLVIPRGSSDLVRHVQQHTRIPVLGHAEGICHVYVDAAADPAKARAIVLDAKLDYPAACNAMETLLLHASLDRALITALEEAGVRVTGGPRAVERFGLEPAADLHHEYGDLACAVEIVDDVHTAISHIHRYGSAHTDAVVTEDPAVARTFLDRVDSACVFHNASTRFADGYRFGLGAEVGISTSRIHARGPVGVEGLLTTRWRLVGQGDTAGPFSRGERTFTHRPL